MHQKAKLKNMQDHMMLDGIQYVSEDTGKCIEYINFRNVMPGVIYPISLTMSSLL